MTTIPRLTGNRCERGEMRALGMSVNDLGFWIERRRDERYQKRRPRAQETRSALTLTHGEAQ